MKPKSIERTSADEKLQLTTMPTEKIDMRLPTLGEILLKAVDPNGTIEGLIKLFKL